MILETKTVGGLVVSLTKDNNSKGFVKVRDPSDNAIYSLNHSPVSMEEARDIYMKTIKNQWTAREAYEQALRECRK